MTTKELFIVDRVARAFHHVSQHRSSMRDCEAENCLAVKGILGVSLEAEMLANEGADDAE